MKVLFYSAPKEAPFSNLYKNLGLGNALISNQVAYIHQFPEYKGQVMDLVNEEADQILLVPIEVKSIFFNWLQENSQVNWYQKQVFSEPITAHIIGDDALNEFIAHVVVKEQWESNISNKTTYKSDYDKQSQGLVTTNILFLLIVMGVILLGLYYNLWSTPVQTGVEEQIKTELPSSQERQTLFDAEKEELKALIKAINASSGNNVQPSDVVILFDQTSSVIPSTKTGGEKLVREIVQAIATFFQDDVRVNPNLWTIQEGGEKKLKEHFQSMEKTLRLFSFGGAQINNSSGQCEIYFPPESQTLSSRSDSLAIEMEKFYWDHIFDEPILKEPKYESPPLAQWQAWKKIQQIQPLQQNYYQILITNGDKSPPQKGNCQQDDTIQTRINEWSQHYQEDLLVLNYRGTVSRWNITITISQINANANLPTKIAQLGNRLLSIAETTQVAVDANSSALANKPSQLSNLDDSTEQLKYVINNLWVLIAAILVILMQAGFALLETGFNASKNVVNIMFKNIMNFSLGVLAFFFIGFTLMFGQTHYGWIGFDAFMLTSVPEVDISPYIFFLFQAAFAATAATICAGSVAGRLRFEIYLIYSIIITAFIYPISGHWVWGGGWLAGGLNPDWVLHDFAGSVVVHAVGGFAGLAGALVLGPRLGKFKEWDRRFLKDNEKIQRELNKRGNDELFPHNLLLAALGMLILWIGWYGFNGGSALGIYEVESVAQIVVNTTLSAAAGGVIVMLVAYLKGENLELTLMLNGAIGGLVGITALCDSVTFLQAILIGSISGIVVIWGIESLVKWKIDDPVGAWPVHGLCGIWGGIAYAVFGYADYPLFQILGSVIIPIWAFVTMLLLFGVLNLIWKNGIRVSPEEELKGLDEYHHGEKALR